MIDKPHLQILIADDHSAIVDAFKSMLTDLLINNEITFSECYSCQETVTKIESYLSNNEFFDLAFLDFSMPPSEKHQISSGGDLANLIRKVMPNCKIIIMTGVMDSITTFDIIQSTKPDAFFFKSDFTHTDLPEIIQTIFEGGFYRSEGIQKKHEEGWDTKFLGDVHNRTIIRYLSLGYKIKEISAKMALTEAAINKRISKIKDNLNIKETSGLLKEAKIRNYI